MGHFSMKITHLPGSLPGANQQRGVQLTVPENIGAERTLPGILVPKPVNSSVRITAENNGKILPQRDRENAYPRASGGEDGIAVQPSLAREMAVRSSAGQSRRVSRQTQPCCGPWSGDDGLAAWHSRLCLGRGGNSLVAISEHWDLALIRRRGQG